MYRENIWARPRIIALNKLDILPAGDFNELREKFESCGHPIVALSGATGEGTERLLDAILEGLEAAQTVEVPVLTPDLQSATDLNWDVIENEEGFEVVGRRILRMVEMTDLANEEALRYLHRRLERLGVIEKLRQAGAQEGDEVTIGDLAFSFTDEQ
jgi:GTP-binding protein